MGVNSICFEALDLTPAASPADVRARWRELAASGLHPDHGGVIDKWLVLEAHYRKALALSRQPVLCTACNGRKKVYQAAKGSFHGSWDTCGKCDGSGLNKM